MNKEDAIDHEVYSVIAPPFRDLDYRSIFVVSADYSSTDRKIFLEQALADFFK